MFNDLIKINRLKDITTKSLFNYIYIYKMENTNNFLIFKNIHIL